MTYNPDIEYETIIETMYGEKYDPETYEDDGYEYSLNILNQIYYIET